MRGFLVQAQPHDECWSGLEKRMWYARRLVRKAVTQFEAEPFAAYETQGLLERLYVAQNPISLRKIDVLTDVEEIAKVSQKLMSLRLSRPMIPRRRSDPPAYRDPIIQDPCLWLRSHQ